MSTQAPQKQANIHQGQTRNTRQRQVVLEEVRKVHSHPTADEVYQMVRRRLPRVSLGTVYRNLDRLSREGLIRTIEGQGLRRYDGETADHAHLRCTGCGTIVDVDLEPLDPEQLTHPGFDFQISGVQVEVLGVCGECLKTRIQDPESSSRNNSRKKSVER